MEISSERKKELREQYKLMKPDMGIFAVIRKTSRKHYLETAHNLKAAMNSAEFQSHAVMHPKRDLQKDWRELGSE